MRHSPIYAERLLAFVVDEAHSVKTWWVATGCCIPE